MLTSRETWQNRLPWNNNYQGVRKQVFGLRFNKGICITRHLFVQIPLFKINVLYFLTLIRMTMIFNATP